MAVAGDRNGVVVNDGLDDDMDWLFDAESLSDSEQVPPHLKDVSRAVLAGDVDALLLALDNLTGRIIDEAIEDGDTALHLRCVYCHAPCVQLLLERGANLECQDEDGATPLHDACAGGKVEIVEMLMNAASEECIKQMLETTDVDGDTPLHHAARGEHSDVVKLLLAAGASPDVANVYGKTPADLPDLDTEVKRVLEAQSMLRLVV